MNFTIYYRGQPITTVTAKNAAGALRAYSKQFALGTKGTTIAVPETATVAERQEAMKASLAVGGAA